jgi:hypothetical protein
MDPPSQMPNETLIKLRGLSDHFAERKRRAKERLSTRGLAGWYFGIVGLNLEGDSFYFADKPVSLEAVEEPPGEVELASALKQQHLFGAIGRYSHGIKHELRVLKSAGMDDETAFNLAWWIISLIRVRTLSEFLVPAASDHSWSVIAGLDANICNIQFIEDVPTAKRLAASSSISKSDLQWVSQNITKFVGLLETPSFRLAVESLSTHQHQASDRMMVAMLWSGIEALFNVHSELRFRLATFIASALEPPGVSRRNLYQRLKRLYDIRSKAVHGGKLAIDDIHEHTVEVRRILSRLLCTFVEEGHVSSEQELENELFGVAAF